MNNLQPVDLHDVGAYWKSRGLVDDHHLSYYVRWLQHFLAGPGGDSRLAPEDAQREFVGQLERDRILEWQIRQAARAWIWPCMKFALSQHTSRRRKRTPSMFLTL